MMTFYSLLESFLFVSMGLVFVLIVLMVYHFKKKIDNLEKKVETLSVINKTLVNVVDEFDIQTKNGGMPKTNSAQSLMNPFFSMPKDGSNIVFTDFPEAVNSEFPSDWKQSNDFYKSIIVSDEMLDPNLPPILNYKVEGGTELDDIHTCSTGSNESNVQESTSNDTNMEELDFTENNGNIQVTKLETDSSNGDNIDAASNSLPVDVIIDDAVESVLTEDPDHHQDNESVQNEIPITPQAISTKVTKKSLQKMNVQMLKAMVIRDGICTEPSKMKKIELINMVLQFYQDQEKESDNEPDIGSISDQIEPEVESDIKEEKNDQDED
tara:strand:- start:167 stop:1138 length:972 start_codon:yes stop_codon:yes gene_type:complete